MIGLVLAVVLFAINYGRVELVREVAFGETYRSNVDRPAEERAELRGPCRARPDPAGRAGSSSSARRTACWSGYGIAPRPTPPRFLVIDLRRVTGVDSSAVVAFVKVMRLAEADGFEVVFTGASDPVRAQLARGGVVAERWARHLRARPGPGAAAVRGRAAQRPRPGRGRGGDPARVASTDCPRASPPTSSASRCPRARSCSTRTTRRATSTSSSPAAWGWRPSRPRARGSGCGRSVRGSSWARSRSTPGSLAPPTWWPRPRAWSCASAARSIERLEAEEPELAAALHRWLATTLAERLSDTRGALDALLD